MKPDRSVVVDPWQALATAGGARIGLGRAGGSLPTGPLLAFEQARARARDAVARPLDVDALARALATDGLDAISVTSRVADRRDYLLRPDAGRRLDDRSAAALRAPAAGWDLAIVLADGLSAAAVERHARPVLAAALPVFARWGWRVAPPVIATHARVALGDDVGERLGAALVAVFIGERPGLSAPDSLGIYLTLAPRVGRTDAERNCLSNIRPGGLAADDAAHALLYLAREARASGRSGVTLKDDSARAPRLVGDVPAEPLP